MSLGTIRAALQGRLSAWNALQAKPYAIAWENVKFTPPDGVYLRVNTIPATTGSEDLKGDHRAYMGVWQITIVGLTDISPAHVDTLANQLDLLYSNGDRITAGTDEVLIATPMTQGAAIADAGRYIVPVWCRYRMDTI